jgi:hypothetical protein
MFLWVSTQTDLRGTNAVGLGIHTLVSSPKILVVSQIQVESQIFKSSSCNL